MNKEEVKVRGFKISNLTGLDPVTVYLEDMEPGEGKITITCFGCAWTSYWRAMGDRTVAEFVYSAGTDYLVTKLGITQWLKQTKVAHKYLARIIDAVKLGLERNKDVPNN